MAYIQIQNLPRFLSIAREARADGIYEHLALRLKQLQDFGRGREDKETKVVLGYDFAPRSFGFALINPGCTEPCIVGGLIFHPGYTEDGSLAVEIDPAAGPHWSVHT